MQMNMIEALLDRVKTKTSTNYEIYQCFLDNRIYQISTRAITKGN